MKANELRIGNFVDLHIEVADRWINGRELSLNDIDCISSGASANPIPLTEEWLLRFGFEKLHSTEYEGLFAYQIPKWGRVVIKDGILISDQYYFLDGLTQQIKFVHQLQNLYFALTGEELQLK